jgi:hypothetical protein
MAWSSNVLSECRGRCFIAWVVTLWVVQNKSTRVLRGFAGAGAPLEFVRPVPAPAAFPLPGGVAADVGEPVRKGGSVKVLVGRVALGRPRG